MNPPIWTVVKWVDHQLFARHRDDVDLDPIAEGLHPIADGTCLYPCLAGLYIGHGRSGRCGVEQAASEYGAVFPDNWIRGIGVPGEFGVPLPFGWDVVEPALGARITIINENHQIDVGRDTVTVSVGANDDVTVVTVSIAALEAAIAQMRLDDEGGL